MALAVLVWPSGSLEDRALEARAETASAQEAVSAAGQAEEEAETAREQADAREREARRAGEQTAEAAAALASAREQVAQAEQVVLLALATSFSAADDVVGAQNAAVERGNLGDPTGERAVITGTAVPALEDYRDALSAAEAALADLRSAVVVLQRELP